MAEDNIPPYLRPNEPVEAQPVSNSPIKDSITDAPVKVVEQSGIPTHSPTVPVFDHVNKTTVQVPRDQLPAFLSDGRYGIRKDVPIEAIDPEGQLVDLHPEDAAAAFSTGGFRPATQEELRSFEVDKKYGDSTTAATMAGIARGLSAGLSDVALTKSGVVAPETLAGLEEANPKASALGEGVGIVAPIIATLGAEAPLAAGARAVMEATPAALAMKTGQVVTKKLEQALLKEGITGATAKSIVNKIAPVATRAIGSAVEGAAFSTGHLLSENALGRAEVNAENLMAHIGTGAILGGVLAAGTDVALAGAGKLKQSISDVLAKGPFEGFTNKQKALVGLLAPGQSADKVMREFTPDELERGIQIFKEAGLAKPIMSKGDMLNKLDSIVENTGDTLKTIKAVSAEAEKKAGLQTTAADVYNSAIQRVEDLHLKPLNLTAKDFTDKEIKALSKKGLVEDLENKIQLLDNDSAIKNEILNTYTLNPLEIEKLQLQIQKNELKMQKMQAVLEDAKVVRKGNYAANSPNPEAKAAMEVIKELRQGAKSTADMTLDMIHNERQVIDKQLRNAFKSGEFNIKQDVLMTQREAYKELYNAKVTQLSKAGLIDKSIADSLIQKNNDFSLAIKMRDMALKNLGRGKEFSAASMMLGATALGVSSHFGTHPLLIGGYALKTFAESDFRRRLVIAGMLEGANNGIQKMIGGTAEALSTAGKIVGKAYVPAQALTSSPLSMFEGKKAKTEQEAYDRIVQNLNKLRDPEQGLNYANKRTLKLTPYAPETTAAMDAKITTALSFLASKTPKGSGPRGFAQKDAGKPRDSEFQVFKRYHAAVMNPQYAINAVLTGTAGKPEIETLQVVYPEIYKQLNEASLISANAAKRAPTYKNRSMLTKVVGTPSDSSFNKQMVMKLQSNFMQPVKPGPSKQSTNIEMDVNKYGTDLQRVLTKK